MKNGKVMREPTLVCFLGVFFLELVDTTRCIYQHVLTRKERVRHIGNFQLHQGVLVAIFPFQGFFSVRCRTAKEGVAVCSCP